MKTSVQAGLFALLFIVLAFVAFVKDDALWGFLFTLAGIIYGACAFVCQAIERSKEES